MLLSEATSTDIMEEEDMPSLDFSALSEEEIQIINDVMQKFQQCQSQDNEIVRQQRNEVDMLEEAIGQRLMNQKKSGGDLISTCNICLHTKFADGRGSECHYCAIKCCTRCSGLVHLRSQRVLRICILCRKRQEVITKSGQWMAMARAGPSGSAQPNANGDNRHQLVRSHSAAENDNQPMPGPSGCALRRQYSQQETQAREEERRYYKGELDGLMHSQGYHPPAPEYRTEPFCSEPSTSMMDAGGSKKHLTKKHLTRRNVLTHQRSSSSDDEYRATPDFSCEERDTRAVTGGVERREKKTVRFGTSAPGKVSGTDTSSTFTSSEDSNSASKQHVSWNESEDGRMLEGHMILRKTILGVEGQSSATILGMKVVEWKHGNTGNRGGLIEKVVKGSVADVEGQLRSGDEILEWNKRSLKGKSFQEIQRIIQESNEEESVEILVCRPNKPDKDRHSRLPHPPGHCHKDIYSRKERPSVLVTSPGSSEYHRHIRRNRSRSHSNEQVGGRIQVQLCYEDTASELAITIIRITNLIPRNDGGCRRVIAKMFLLPDKSDNTRRSTKPATSNDNYKWDQTFYYYDITNSDIKYRVIEITVWDYLNFGAKDFLGEVLIELNHCNLDNKPLWFNLCPRNRRMVQQIPGMDIERATPPEHYSPLFTSRYSDSEHDPLDVSDPEDTNRKCADGCSVSSLNSSNSPPLDIEKSNNRQSRRDMSPQSKKSMMIQFGSPTVEPHQKVIENPRSHSAAPTDSPSVHNRSRSKSPHRTLSPSEYNFRHVSLPSHAYVPRFPSRSETTTPITSPKKRQLPQIPQHPAHHSSTLRDRVSHDIEDRPQTSRQRQRNVQHRGWNRHGVVGLSDSDLRQEGRRHRSPSDKEIADPCDSDKDSGGSVTSSSFSTQSEIPRKNRFNEYGEPFQMPLVGREEPRNNSMREPFSRSLSNTDVPVEERGDGSLSDTALNLQHASGSRRRTPGSSGAKSSGMGKKCSSTSQISATGRKRRLGFGTKGKSSFTVHRSEEVVPDDIRHLVKQGSSVSSDGEGSQDGDSLAQSVKGSNGGPLTEFIDGLGAGQLVGRQVLGEPSLGDIQLCISYRKDYLDVEVVRARNLQAKPHCKVLPAPYVKVYLVKGKKCIAKAKTTIARKTLNPLYQQQLTFRGPFENGILQVTVWGDYGRMEGKKVFMGVAQIMLDDVITQKIDLVCPDFQATIERTKNLGLLIDAMKSIKPSFVDNEIYLCTGYLKGLEHMMRKDKSVKHSICRKRICICNVPKAWKMLFSKHFFQM